MTTERRVIGILAHVDAGKTTLSEQLLHVAGEIRRPGTVERGNTVTDWLEDEQERGITISTAAAGLCWRGVSIDVVDTPGHVDFSVEIERTLRVLDGAVLVVSAPDGVQAQTEAVWAALRREGIPTVVFVNKLDAPHEAIEHLLTRISEGLDVPLLPLQHPVYEDEDDVFTWYGHWDLLSPGWCEVDAEGCDRDVPLDPFARQARERLIEALAEVDDRVMAYYVDGVAPPMEVLLRVVAQACRDQRALPVVFGAAALGHGVEALLDEIARMLPCPAESRQRLAFDPSGQPTPIRFDPAADPFAYVFKTETRDRAVIAYVRIFDGVVRAGSRLFRRGHPCPSASWAPVRLLGRDTLETDSLVTGAVGGLVFGVDEVAGPTTGDTLGSAELALAFERPQLGLPVVWVTLEGADASAHERLGAALRRLAADDPSLVVSIERVTGQFLIGGRGELQLEIVCRRLGRVLGDEGAIRVGEVCVRRHRRLAADVAGRGSAQDAEGRGDVAISIQIRPDPACSDPVTLRGLQVLGDDPIRAAAVRAGIDHVIAGLADSRHDLDPVAITIVGVSQSGSEQVSPLLYRDAAARALEDALVGASWDVFEPQATYDAVVPHDSVGRFHAELSRRGVDIPPPSDTFGQFQVYRGLAPLGRLLGFARVFRSLGSGRGHWGLRPAGLGPAQERPTIEVAP